MASLKSKVLLIGWDGADWEHINPLLDQGHLPTLESLIDGGVMGNLATLQPVLSPMLWNSVATGKLADKHGIHGFIEPDPNSGGVRPYSSYSRTTKALWNIFTQSGLRSNVINWWASHPAEPINGFVCSNAFGGVRLDPQAGWKIASGVIHPADRALDYAPLKVFPNELTSEHILPFIPAADKIDQENDPLLQSFAKLLADCASTHNVATAAMEFEPWDFMAIYYPDIDHFCHGFMQFHPPQMPHVPDDKFEIYQHVITGIYRFHDMMLDRLLQLAGDETTVVLCSDHGFQSKAMRPLGTPREPAGPAIWHRQYGALVMRGPGIRKDERIYGASLIDIGPTILTMFDLPVGEDMDGRPLVEAFEEPPEIKSIPSWEEIDGESGMHGCEEHLDPAESEALLQQFIALGYVEDPGSDKQKASESADIEAKYNLARLHMWTSRFEVARKLLEEIVTRRPWEDRFLVQLVNCYFNAGYIEQAKALVQEAFDLAATANFQLKLTWGRLLLASGDRPGALASFLEFEQNAPHTPNLLRQLGEIYLQLRRLDDAQRMFETAVELHPENALAYQGLSTLNCRKGRYPQAIDAALSAVSLLHRLPRAHFNLGVGLARCGEPDRAAVAFKTALQFAPRMRHAHRWLDLLYRTQLKDPDLAALHRSQAGKLLREHQNRKKTDQSHQQQRFDLPEIPPPETRHQTLLQERPGPKQSTPESGKRFVVVSGLPRSGTSLMMRILEAGGLPAMTDGVRQADDDNPLGYYEWEAIKQIGSKPELLDDMMVEGRAFKAISALLKQLPTQHEYRVLFMMRPTAEVTASQTVMLQNRGEDGSKLSLDELERGLELHRAEILSWARTAPHVQLQAIDYPTLVSSPNEIIPKIVDFVGADLLPNAEAMREPIEPSLYRQRNR